MRIYNKVVWQWNGTEYVKTYEEFSEYTGPVALACGASSEQKGIEQKQSDLYNQMASQAGQVFGDASQVFNNLMNTFAPTIKAGPSQQGFSPAELSAYNSQAISGTAQDYKNAKAAVGNAQSAYGGGNTVLPAGYQAGVDAALAADKANETSNQLLGIQEQNYAVGRQNYDKAVQGMESSTGVFNSATGMDNAATGAGEAAANTANQISQQNNSWMSAVGGVLGSVAGAATGGLMKMLPTGGSTGGGMGNLPTTSGLTADANK